VRFLRHLAAVATLVAVVVLIGLAWNHLAPHLPGEGGPTVHLQGVPRGNTILAPRGKKLPPGAKPPAGAKPRPGHAVHIGSGIPAAQLGDLLKAPNLDVLRSTAELEAAVITAVLIVDAAARKWRRKLAARRRASGSA